MARIVGQVLSETFCLKQVLPVLGNCGIWQMWEDMLWASLRNFGASLKDLVAWLGSPCKVEGLSEQLRPGVPPDAQALLRSCL